MSTEAALERVRKLAVSWATLAEGDGPHSLADEVSAHCGRLVLDMVHGGGGSAESRLERLTCLAESWTDPGGTFTWDVGGTRLLAAIRGNRPAASWQDRAEAAERKLAEIGTMCRDIRSSVKHGATPIVAVERVLAIIGSEGTPDHA